VVPAAVAFGVDSSVEALPSPSVLGVALLSVLLSPLLVLPLSVDVGFSSGFSDVVEVVVSELVSVFESEVGADSESVAVSAGGSGEVEEAPAFDEGAGAAVRLVRGRHASRMSAWSRKEYGDQTKQIAAKKPLTVVVAASVGRVTALAANLCQRGSRPPYWQTNETYPGLQ